MVGSKRLVCSNSVKYFLKSMGFVPPLRVLVIWLLFCGKKPLVKSLIQEYFSSKTFKFSLDLEELRDFSSGSIPLKIFLLKLLEYPERRK